MVTLHVSSLHKLPAEFRAALYDSPFALYTKTTVWTWDDGGCAVVGITPTRGPRVEGWCFYRLKEGDRPRTKVGFSVAVGPVLKSHGIESTVADPGHIYEDSSPVEVFHTLLGK